MNLSKNLSAILNDIRNISGKKHSSEKNITLIAVSKTKPVSMIKEALDAGQVDFGENYVQEFLEKYDYFCTGVLPYAPTQDIHWHFIGHLQRRKVKDLVGKVSLIHSVDSLELISEINKRAKDQNVVQNILIQINLAKEETKGGIFEEDVVSFFKNVGAGLSRPKEGERTSPLQNVRITGLMTLPPFLDDSEKVRPYFKKLRELKEKINNEKIYPHELTELSMGMSHDYPIAIEEGATMIRVGTKIFGER